MLEIGNVLVSLDVAEQYFCCDLDQCLGECCIEGDAGAPITEQEGEKIAELAPTVWDDLAPSAQQVIKEQGVSYIDEEGVIFTSIVNGPPCFYTCYPPAGKCICACDKAYREGKTQWRKPISCYLYPLRITEYPSFTAVNYHRWKICRSAEANGRRLGIRLYQFMREPLIERFGQEWYEELAEACQAWNQQNS